MSVTQQWLWAYKDGKLVFATPVTTGMPGRQSFGPGTEVPHTDPNGAHETGSHSGVNVTYDAAKGLYNWTALGATVDIVAA